MYCSRWPNDVVLLSSHRTMDPHIHTQNIQYTWMHIATCTFRDFTFFRPLFPLLFLRSPIEFARANARTLAFNLLHSIFSCVFSLLYARHNSSTLPIYCAQLYIVHAVQMQRQQQIEEINCKHCAHFIRPISKVVVVLVCMVTAAIYDVVNGLPSINHLKMHFPFQLTPNVQYDMHSNTSTHKIYYGFDGNMHLNWNLKWQNRFRIHYHISLFSWAKLRYLWPNAFYIPHKSVININGTVLPASIECTSHSGRT